MRSAEEGLSPFLGQAPLVESEIPIIMNAIGDVARTSQEIRQRLKEQVTGIVYWEKGIRTMDALGCTHFIEIGPGTTLSGMNKRIGTPAPTLSISTTAQLEGLDALIERS